MPYVSVIIPCYNCATYIGQCLYGLEMQSYRDFDVILVDDCSTDDTEEFIKEYSENSNLILHYYKNKHNMGPSYSRKTGIELSTAEYIAFCDSDDWYEPNYLELMVAKAKENCADMVFCAYQTVSIKKEKAKKNPHLLEFVPEMLSIRNVLQFPVDSLCVTFVKRRIFQSIKFPNIRNGEDMAIIPLMIVESRSFGVMNECLYNYLYRENSASLVANENVVNSLINSFKFIEANMPEEYQKECEFLGIRNLLYGGLLALFKYSYDTKKAREILSNFENKYPKWKENNCINSFSFYKKIFLKFAGMRFFLCLKVLSIIHLILTRN